MVILYGTLGKGLENLASSYLIESVFPKLDNDYSSENKNGSCSIVDFSEGKLSFQCALSATEKFREVAKCGIKFFERLFVQISRKSLIEEDGSKVNKSILFDLTYSALLDSNYLLDSFQIWRKLRSSDPSDPSKFRLSCKCTGKWRRKIDVDRLCESLGPKIAQRMNWRMELRKPEFEISIRVSDSNLFIGFALTKEPFSKRGYIRHMGLRGSVCDAMVKLADIRSDHVVLDPMCGMGTILFETMDQIEHITTVGVEIDQRQLSLALENYDHFLGREKSNQYCETIRNNSCSSSITIIPADCQNLPFRDQCFDRIISDIPFGQQHLTLNELKTFYPRMLGEMLRVLKRTKGSKIVLLTGSGAYSILRDSFTNKTKSETEYISETHKIDISLGETNGVLVVYTVDQPTGPA